MARAPRRAGGDGLDCRPGPHGGRVASREHRRAAGHHRVGVDRDLGLLDGNAIGAVQEVVDQRLADATITVSAWISTNSPSMGSGGRQPRSLG